MSPLPPVLAGLRRAAAPCGLAAALLLATAPAAQAQRLLTLVPSVAEASSADGPGPSIGPVPTAVEVDLELLRSAPLWLEVPTPDGSVLSAERSVFEDRGGGDLMWSGGHPDAGYDTVVLTVEGGRLVGRFGAAGGGAYQIHAASDGRGGMAPVGGPRPEGVPFCGVETVPEAARDAAAHVRSGSRAAHPPQPVSNPQSHDRLDILVGYTATAARNWAGIGGPEAAIRHAGDYLKMVFRNNELPVEPHIVHIAQASAALDRVGRDLGYHERHMLNGDPLADLPELDGELRYLRHKHRADLLHLFTGEPALLLGACGAALQLEGSTAEKFAPWAYGWTTNNPLWCDDYAVTFAHEIGHGLDASHDTSGLGHSADLLYRPYAVGHVNYDAMPTIGTAMSYRGQIEPLFSTPRIRPWAAAVGVVGEADNERRLRETVHTGARYSDYLVSVEGLPAPPSDLRVWMDGGVARLSWRDSAPDAEGYEVEYRWSERGAGWRRFSLIRVGGRSGATVPLRLTEPGTRHEFVVRALKGGARSLRSDRVMLVLPGEPVATPSDVSVTISPGLVRMVVHWTDNSDNESGFDVQLLQNGEVLARSRVAADSEKSSLDGLWVMAQGGAEYGVRVFAYNSAGYSESSEVATFRWAHPYAPRPVAGVSVTAVGPTTVRVAWTIDPEVLRYHVYAELPNWDDIRSGHQWYNVSGGTAWTDFENLARGGRYRFRLSAEGRHTSAEGERGWSARSWHYLTLGERGVGPAAPSDLSLVKMDDGRIRVSWRDRSDEELGFEVQSDSTETRNWERELTVPAGTESVAFTPFVDFAPSPRNIRVFAYNERGYSLAASPAGSCREDARTLCLRHSRFEVKMEWRTASGEADAGRAVLSGTNESGLFYFFDPENWEALIKVLDGCAINGRMWVLGASTTDLGYRIEVTDTVTGESRSYGNEPGQPAPAIVDTAAFPRACDGAVAAGSGSSATVGDRRFIGSTAGEAGSASAAAAAASGRTAGACQPDAGTLCLGEGRFSLGIEASTMDEERREGRVARLGTNKSGLFHFFQPENWEVLVKVLDGCAINGRHWVFAASATDLGLDLRVKDTMTGGTKTYGTTAGQPAPAIVDTEAFDCAAGAAGR